MAPAQPAACSLSAALGAVVEVTALASVAVRAEVVVAVPDVAAPDVAAAETCPPSPTLAQIWVAIWRTSVGKRALLVLYSEERKRRMKWKFVFLFGSSHRVERVEQEREGEIERKRRGKRTRLIRGATTGRGEAGDDGGSQLPDLCARAREIRDVAVDLLGSIADTGDGAGGDLFDELVDCLRGHAGGEEKGDEGVLHRGSGVGGEMV
ncbi:hypothetical protein CTA2_10533 [Colletotrichum tanaceti]|nr:hypothetical protein CTA2_10533 [Colletotrichum tanaceti]